MKNMTEGSPVKLLIGFIVPLLLGLLFQQFYYMVDMIVVGKFLGMEALAGVGSTDSINFLVLGFCTGTCAGFSIPVAQKFGQQDMEGLRRIVGNIIWLGVFLAAGITVLVTFLCRHILTWMHTPAETFGYAYQYLFIVFLGIPATMLYNMLSGIIRSLGDSRTPLYFLIFSSALNILLDMVLILWAGMGVAGAATATVTAQLLSGVLCLLYMVRRYPVLHLSREHMKLRGEESGILLSMGIPMGLQYSITAVGSILLQSSINHLGAIYMAAATAGGRALALLGCPYEAIGTAAATFTGQNVGAGRLDRVHRGLASNLILGLIYSALALAAVLLWGRPLLMLFLNPGEPQAMTILELGRQFLLGNVLFYSCLLCVNLFRFSIQGMGFSKLAIIAGALELIARAALGVFMVPKLGFIAACFASPAAWVLADLFLIPMYFAGVRTLRGRV